MPLKRNVYLAASWSSDHDALNNYVVRELAVRHDLLLVGDHKTYRDQPHERGLRFRERVDENLRSCSGFVAMFPSKHYGQTTAPYMFLELLLAIKHKLPILILFEEGILVRKVNTEDGTNLVFGDVEITQENTLTLADINKKNFTTNSLIDKYSLSFRTSEFFNKPIFLSPNNLHSPNSDLFSTTNDFIGSLIEPNDDAYFFHISPYNLERERFITSKAVFEETGLASVNASDHWGGGPFTREQIVETISNSSLNIADMTGHSRACIFEAGVSVGSGKPTFVVKKKNRRDNTSGSVLPFGVDQIPALQYGDESELDAIVRQHCRGYRRRVFNLELGNKSSSSNAAMRKASHKSQVVLLVHGIRTQGEWQEQVRSALQRPGLTTVFPIKYGYFDVIRFWFPFFTRAHPVRTLHWKIKRALELNPNSEVSVIAHSFGSYAVTKILGEDPNFRPSRMIFCGSIVPQDFRWDLIPNCPKIINECGQRDIWPILAAGTTWGYGPSGAFGFGTPGVEDRFHDFGHSDYFDRRFIDRYWAPWIHESIRYDSSSGDARLTTSYWKSIVSIYVIRLLIIAILSIAIYQFLY